MKVYLACSFEYGNTTLTNERKLAIEKVAHILMSKGMDVFIPHKCKIPNAYDYPADEWSLMVFTNDMTHIQEADIVVLMSYGRELNNSGVCWECGFAYGIGKKVIIVKLSTDCEPESLMMWHGSYAQLNGIAGLNAYDFKDLKPIRTSTTLK